MLRTFAVSLVLAVACGALLLPLDRVNAQAVRPGGDLIAPPLIESRGAETPIRLRHAEVDVRTRGGLARTTLLLTLFNPNARQLEGNLSFPLRAGQQVTGFALDVDGALRDAVPVPKNKAQQVFESIERRNVDPGLLEQTAGNHFRLRVYPIPAGGTRRVRLVIDEAMPRDGAHWRLQVPVHLLAGAARFDLRLRAEGLRAPPETVGTFDGLRFVRRGRGYAAEIQRNDFRPAAGLALRLPASETAETYVQSFGDERFALVEAPVQNLAPVSRRAPDHITLLWDASASGKRRDHAAELALLARYFGTARKTRVTLHLLRDVGETVGTFDLLAGDWSALRTALESVVYDGASDLSDWPVNPESREFLLFSDGLHTYGAAQFPTLRPGQTLYAINAAGAQSDAARLTALAEPRGGRYIALEGRAGVEAAATQLLTRGTRIVALEGEGIADLQPQSWYVDDGLLRVAGRLTESQATLRATVEEGGVRRVIETRIDATDIDGDALVAQLWANWRIAALAGNPEYHRGTVTALGQRFGIVTPGTSLLVLEALEDYVRHDIPAPPAIAAQVAELRRTRQVDRDRSRGARLDDVARRFAERRAWWERDFPKGRPPRPDAEKRAAAGAAPAAYASAPPAPPPSPAPAPMEIAEADAAARSASAEEAADDSRRQRAEREALPGQAAPRGQAERAAGEGVSIRLQAWTPDTEYGRRLRDAAPTDLYRLYLDERDNHATSTAFYLDVADLLLRKGREAEAMRVLSNLAELDLENRHILRVLGYRLMQAKRHARAVDVFREVLRLADEEPQSHRDLGLALAADNQRQAGIVHLYDVVAREWDPRFSEIELVALNELNAIIATSPTPLDTDFIDPRLLKNMPLDLRVALAWDSDNSDMDLWVTDPNGERCYYGNRNTYQGGLMSDDFTGGYGPEEFVLKDAKPGKYKVEANFYGDRQQVVTGATTLMLRLSTGWGTKRQVDQSVTLRLSGKSETVFVGEFEVK